MNSWKSIGIVCKMIYKYKNKQACIYFIYQIYKKNNIIIIVNNYICVTVMLISIRVHTILSLSLEFTQYYHCHWSSHNIVIVIGVHTILSLSLEFTQHCRCHWSSHNIVIVIGVHTPFSLSLVSFTLAVDSHPSFFLFCGICFW